MQCKSKLIGRILTINIYSQYSNSSHVSTSLERTLHAPAIRKSYTIWRARCSQWRERVYINGSSMWICSRMLLSKTFMWVASWSSGWMGELNSFLLLQMKFSQLRKANDGKFKPYLGISNVTLDICMFLKNGPHSFLLDIVSASLKKFLTPYHSCPYSVNA